MCASEASRVLKGLSWLFPLLAFVSCSDSVAPPDPAADQLNPLFAVGDAAVTLSGYGVATIDGVLTSGEWYGAGRVQFELNLPATMGGGTAPATLYVMNDHENLYLAVAVSAAWGGEYGGFYFEFDNDDDGTRENGDDIFGFNMDQRGTSVFLDNFRIFTGTWLGPMDNESPYDGTIDGAGAWGRDGGVTVVEMAHPLNSTDNDHDFSLAEGDAVGFYGFFGLWDPDDDSSSGWTDFPVPYWNIPEWGDIIVAAPDPQTKEDCLDDHWRLLGFDNVGMCMRYFRTGVDTRN